MVSLSNAAELIAGAWVPYPALYPIMNKVPDTEHFFPVLSITVLVTTTADLKD